MFSTWFAKKVSPPPGCPNSFLIPTEGRAEVFDPALKSYSRAFRLGDPNFEKETDRLRWHAARAAVREHILRLIGMSPWRDQLVLRGSVLLRALFGQEAREPGDIDWVVLPQALKSSQAQSGALIKDIAALVKASPEVAGVRIDAKKTGIDPIWTYERADGIRLTFAWTLEGLPPGTQQLDFVFGETMWEEPVWMHVPFASHAGTSAGVMLLAATPALSLAWKILWLGCDMHPQGKDLYDAVLLAERTGVSPDLLTKVAFNSEVMQDQQLALPLSSVEGWSVDWDNFKLEYPWIKGDAAEWKHRLVAAIQGQAA